MMQDISNLLVFDIDNDNNTNYIDTFFPQSSVQSSYNFSSSDEFRNDHYQHHDVTAQHSFDDIELPDSSKETEEYLETNQKDGEIMHRISYECSRSGNHNSQVSSDPTKRQNATSQRT
ncbi:hypothetical protein RhiirC2_794965 [Rhizophagus irregularis]|uniref:Uncharacterized protein n=1 Tax=Rhizophagus irregularis TaxID=588596 RepID=A0A2N1MCI3_9GLOM|nr:hypothetical protein RhiirC2_794965 [Rhizophagus irregularis]